MAASTPSWHDLNQNHVVGHLSRLRQVLQCHAALRSGDATVPAKLSAAQEKKSEKTAPAVVEASSQPTALDMLCGLFRLSPFERDVLLLCAGMELASDFAGLCATAQGDPARHYPTFSLCLAALPEAHWSALTPAAPLRRNRLIEIGSSGSLTNSPLTIDERILHFIVGVNHFDERLRALIDFVPVDSELPPSYALIANEIAAIWRQAAPSGSFPVIQLCGPSPTCKRRIAAAACASVGLNLCAVSAESLNTDPVELDSLLRLWEREYGIAKCALLLEYEDAQVPDAPRRQAVYRAFERANGIVLISTREREPSRQKVMVSFDIDKPTVTEQQNLWRATLGAPAETLNGRLDELTAQFDLTDQAIRMIGAEALGRTACLAEPNGKKGSSELAGILWDTCRVSARTRLDDLAQRIEPAAGWNDLILPEAQMLILRDIASHVRRRHTVYQNWGFAGKGKRGLGISALFAGTSGTGKTMAAEVLANELRLDLYRIDLSAVVSKYIGESEKNLRRVFDAAEECGAILLFDEADALFGKRSEVKDSHDRYANLEVSYLLQRMESYRGLAILTTNLKSALDTAFLRRLRFVLQFPFPDSEQRAAIWKTIFPSSTPTDGLDPAKLAQLNIAGGNIRNMALNAAFIAADAGEPVRMSHVLRAAQAEYDKLEKTLTQAEIAGWV
jgi:hypothetical protein